MEKHFIKYLILLFLSINLYSQESKIKVLSNLNDFKEIWFDKTSWSLAYGKTDSLYLPIDYSKICPYIKEMVKARKYFILPDFEDVRDKNINGIDSFYMLTKLLGQDQLAMYLTNKGTDVPFKIFTRSDSSFGILFHGIYIDKIFNTQKFSSSQMAAKIISQYALTHLDRLNQIAFSKDVSAIGMSFVYGSQDFSAKYFSDLKEEIIVGIFPIAIIKKYFKGLISDTELAKESEFFISNRDMLLTFKKIDLTLE